MRGRVVTLPLLPSQVLCTVCRPSHRHGSSGMTCSLGESAQSSCASHGDLSILRPNAVVSRLHLPHKPTTQRVTLQGPGCQSQHFPCPVAWHPSSLVCPKQTKPAESHGFQWSQSSMAATHCSAAPPPACMTSSWASRPCNLCRPLQVMLQTSLTWSFVSCLCSHLCVVLYRFRDQLQTAGA